MYLILEQSVTERIIPSAKTEMMIRKPVKEVFEAIVNPNVTTKFWFTESTGTLQEGKSVIWTWKMYNVSVPVSVIEINANQHVIIEWGEGKHYSKVKFSFKPLSDSKTYLSILNYDFKVEGDELINKVLDATGGFTLLLAGLKAYLEHRIQLNLVADKFPKELMEK
jgi:uncharacterized protein YndB with AHSA1/START domain